MKARLLKKTFWIIAVLLLITARNACANPAGEHVVKGAGDASFDRSTPGTLTVNTASERTIIEYDSFSIAADETVRFNQPGKDSAVLNRVVGADPSAIYGTLSSNGRIFLVNPNGIIFGSASRVDAPAVLASTLDIKNKDFLKGDYKFFENGKGAFIINQGRIAAEPGGYVVLLSQAVNNQGVIIADTGTIVLASGEKMTLALDSLNQISVVVDDAVRAEIIGLDGKKITDAINNSGTIQACGGKVILTAKLVDDLFDYAVNNSGVIQANDVAEHKGIIELVTEGAPNVNTGTMQPEPVDKRKPTLLTVSDITGIYGDKEVTIRAVLTDYEDHKGKPLAKMPVDFYLGGIKNGSADTEKDGVASFIVDISNINAGNYKNYIEAKFGGDEDYQPSNDTADLNINKADAVVNVGQYSVTYDGSVHMSSGKATGVKGEDLSGGLDLSRTSHANAGSYNADAWSFIDKNGNYNSKSGSVNNYIAKANALISVAGYSGSYDGQAHGASGSAAGVGGCDLSDLLDLGASFVNVPGGAASWNFTGGTNYNDAVGSVLIHITAPPSAASSVIQTPLPNLIGAEVNSQLQPEAGGPLQDHRLGPGYGIEPFFLFYHPLTPIDYSAFDNIGLDAGAYDFIDGQLNPKGKVAEFFGITS